MDGGLGPGELGVVAPSGVGKTWILTALGASAVKTRFECCSLFFRVIRTLCW